MSTPFRRFLNTSTLIIGPTGAGKTTLLATAAEYEWETHGRVSALYQTDLGGYPDRIGSLIRHGIIWVFRMRTRGMAHSFETCQLAAKGYWPARFLNTLTGEVPEGVPMVGPTTTEYRQTCGCGTTRSVKYKPLLGNGKCAGCGKSWSVRESVTDTVLSPTPGIDKIGLRMYDGLSSISEWYLQDLSHRRELGGEIGAIGGVVDSGSLSFRGNNRAQVGFAQTRVHELVSQSLAIPNQDVMPIWTAISDENSDSTGRMTIVGPKLAGSAKTEIAPAWFGNTVEAAVVEGPTTDSKIRRLYLSEWVDADGRRHLCKHRGDPRFIPEFLEDPPYSPTEPPEQLCTEFSLGTFFKLLDSAADKAAAETLLRFPDAPGLDAVPTSFGGDTLEEAQAAQLEQTPSTASPKAARAAGGLKPGAGVKPRGKVPLPHVAARMAKEAEAAAAAQEAAPADDAVAAQEALEAAENAAETAPQTIVEAVLATEPTPAPVAVPPPPPPSPAPAVRPAPGGWAKPAGTRPAAARPLAPIRRPVSPPTAS